jgi:hypothetical protein
MRRQRQNAGPQFFSAGGNSDFLPAVGRSNYRFEWANEYEYWREPSEDADEEASFDQDDTVVDAAGHRRNAYGTVRARQRSSSS